MVLQKKPFVYKRFGYHFPAVQITVPTKSQGTQCTLLKEMLLTSTPCASDDEPSDSEEEMDAERKIYVNFMQRLCLSYLVYPHVI